MLTLENVSKEFVLSSGRRFNAVKDVSLDLNKGSVLGMMGDSGCGKSTTALIACRLLNQTSGKILLDNMDVSSHRRKALSQFRRSVQIVFQDPISAFDPLHTIRWSFSEAAAASGMTAEVQSERQDELCQSMDFPLCLLDRFPSEVSGGELQRAAIVRSLFIKPDYLILDEPTSMLDLSTQAQISRGILSIVQNDSIGILWITHDEALAKAVCDRILYMKDGMLVQQS
ncbi:MAG: dipeptide/oligopeptide/nickel ABC transporter ATP-binding protein [Methanomassiliicoccales archaeon]|nr:dipeptide/oligopeptide/nickel ABC transporter ATP-binding protein [Methanomassiliicoccales archaeon]